MRFKHTAVNHNLQSAVNHILQSAVNHNLQSAVNHNLQSAVNHNLQSAVNITYRAQSYLKSWTGNSPPSTNSERSLYSSPQYITGPTNPVHNPKPHAT